MHLTVGTLKLITVRREENLTEPDKSLVRKARL